MAICFFADLVVLDTAAVVAVFVAMTFAGIGSLEMRPFPKPSTPPTQSRVTTTELPSISIRTTTTAVVRSPFSPGPRVIQRTVDRQKSVYILPY